MAEKSKSKYDKLVEKIGYKKKNVWDDISIKDEKSIFKFADEYKKFLDESKTEREAVKNIISLAAGQGQSRDEFVPQVQMEAGSRFRDLLTQQLRTQAGLNDADINRKNWD